MAFRLWRRMKIAPGVTMNISKSGPSFSFGRRGARVSVGRRGRRTTLGIPGSGLSYTTATSWGSGTNQKTRQAKPTARSPSAAVEPVPLQERMSAGLWKRIGLPPKELAVLKGCRHIAESGDYKNALVELRKARGLADGALMAGLAALRLGEFREAEKCFRRAVKKSKELDSCFDRHGFGPVVTLPVSPEFSVELHCTTAVALLAPVMLEWYRGNIEDALEGLRGILERLPTFEEARLCLCLLLDELHAEPATREIVDLSNDTDPESDTGKLILFVRARALLKLGLATAARQTLTSLLRKEKQLNEPLRLAARYERALAYEEEGRSSQSRRELERLFTEAPSYKDVIERLGLD